LVAPDALGQPVSFETGDGPRLKPIETPDDLSGLRDGLDFNRLEPVFETIARVRASLPGEVALIGFCGAPWTVASYMIAGRGTPDQAPARLFAYRHRAAFQALIDLLVEASAEYLVCQLQAGVEAVQIFDSWAGVLSFAEFERWCVAPIAALIAKVRRHLPEAPVIVFPRGAGAHLGVLAEIDGVAAIGLDTTARATSAALPKRMALQGNLDPIALLAGGASLDEAIENVLADFSGRPHIFNLGHGVLPGTPIENVERLVHRVRRA